MKVVHVKVEDFCDEIVRAPRIYQDAVRMLVDATPLQDECVTFRVVVVLTAIVREEDESEYLATCTLPCGVDVVNGELLGTAEVERIRSVLSDLLPESVGVRAGRLEE